MSPRELAKFTDEVMRAPFQLVRLGSLDDLSKRNRSERAAHPEGENEVYPAWQQAQYELSMFSRHPPVTSVPARPPCGGLYL